MEKSSFTIRDATAADTDAMVTIARAAWQPVFDSFRDIMGDELFEIAHSDWQDDKEDQIRSSASASSPVSFLVTECENQIVGFASWIVRSTNNVSIAEIGNNAVDPAFQNNGIATAQYEEVNARCRASGVAAVKVTTGLDPSHAPARRAYEKAGFGSGIPMVTYWQKL